MGDAMHDLLNFLRNGEEITIRLEDSKWIVRFEDRGLVHEGKDESLTCAAEQAHLSVRAGQGNTKVLAAMPPLATRIVGHMESRRHDALTESDLSRALHESRNEIRRSLGYLKEKGVFTVERGPRGVNNYLLAEGYEARL